MSNHTAQSVLDRMVELEELLPNHEDRWKELKAQYEVLAEEDAAEQPLAPDGLKSWGNLGKCTICGKAWEDCSCLTRRW